MLKARRGRVSVTTAIQPVTHMNIAMLDSRLYESDGCKIRVTQFPQLSFGHICLDWHMTHQLAKREGSLIYFVSPEKTINTGVFELQCRDTKVLKNEELHVFKDCREIDAGETTFPYYRRRLLTPPLALSFPGEQVAELQRLCLLAGIQPDAKLVCLHVREAGWYQQISHCDAVLDTSCYPTNARVESYRKAVGYLLSEGYTVVRVGAPSATRVGGPGVVDLANSAYRSDLLELFCLANSCFLIASESGIRQAAELFGLPTLTVNAVDALSCFPLGAKDLYITKHIVDRSNGRRLSLFDLLGYDYNAAYRDTSRWHYTENTEEEIFAAVAEMVTLVHDVYKESSQQSSFKKAVCEAQRALWGLCPYVRKWGIDDGFIGDGYMARSFLEKEWQA
ncbi:TIGR04372 family glycosyltransferase [Trichlorobacter lovleyi]|uniref:TIGR04372 family glycosyltransferase n=1 Tax=Trichlorobacter lovleyi TaxID=313985 RepID=UPI00247FC6D1|nr:TIGR04372 family glycosyltransferase [Trichlorobacter lovleyi]